MTKYVPQPTMFGKQGQPNGVLNINPGWPVLWRTLRFVGGPYAFKPEGMFGVCLLESLKGIRPDGASTLHMPIRDFSIPEDDDRVALVIDQIIDRAVAGEHVYVGCMGGWGRTGLMLSLIAKALGVPEPVKFVRKHYTPKAVETSEQFSYVEDFDLVYSKFALLGRRIGNPFV